jgi:hypothetical protein
MGGVAAGDSAIISPQSGLGKPLIWEPGDLHFQIKRTGFAWANVNGKRSSRPEFIGEPIGLGRRQHL